VLAINYDTHLRLMIPVPLSIRVGVLGGHRIQFQVHRQLQAKPAAPFVK
jgi:hypothetical protein